MNFIHVFRKEMVQQWRTYRFLIILAVLAVFGMTAPLMTKFMPQIFKAIPGMTPDILNAMPAPTVQEAMGQYVKSMNQFGILLAILTTMGLVVQEKEHGTAAFFLTRPVARETFLLAKFGAQLAAFFAAVAVAALGCWYYTDILFKPLAWGPFLAMNGLMLVAFLAYIAISLLGSAIAKSQGAAIGISISAAIVVSILGAIPTIGNYLPARLFTWGTLLALGMHDSAWPALGVTCGIIVAALLAACLIFRRQEI